MTDRRLDAKRLVDDKGSEPRNPSPFPVRCVSPSPKPSPDICIPYPVNTGRGRRDMYARVDCDLHGRGFVAAVPPKIDKIDKNDSR